MEFCIFSLCCTTLQWRHNDHDSISNRQPHGCLLNRLFTRRSKKTSKLRVTGLCVGNSPGPANSLHKGPVTRKMFLFDDIIMNFVDLAGKLTLIHQNHAIIILYVSHFFLGDVKVHVTWFFPQISSVNAVQEWYATFTTSLVQLPRPS